MGESAYLPILINLEAWNDVTAKIPGFSGTNLNFMRRFLLFLALCFQALSNSIPANLDGVSRDISHPYVA
jgi:hypothetical protein